VESGVLLQKKRDQKGPNAPYALKNSSLCPPSEDGELAKRKERRRACFVATPGGRVKERAAPVETADIPTFYTEKGSSEGGEEEEGMGKDLLRTGRKKKKEKERG